MASMSYAERLKDPRWQRRRLERLSVYDFKCADCGSGEKTLHVHHTYYLTGKMPWEYPDEALLVLCAGCHSFREAVQRTLLSMVGQLGECELLMVFWFARGVLDHVMEGEVRETAEIPDFCRIGLTAARMSMSGKL